MEILRGEMMALRRRGFETPDRTEIQDLLEALKARFEACALRDTFLHTEPVVLPKVDSLGPFRYSNVLVRLLFQLKQLGVNLKPVLDWSKPSAECVSDYKYEAHPMSLQVFTRMIEAARAGGRLERRVLLDLGFDVDDETLAAQDLYTCLSSRFYLLKDSPILADFGLYATAHAMEISLSDEVLLNGVDETRLALLTGGLIPSLMPDFLEPADPIRLLCLAVQYQPFLDDGEFWDFVSPHVQVYGVEWKHRGKGRKRGMLPAPHFFAPKVSSAPFVLRVSPDSIHLGSEASIPAHVDIPRHVGVFFVG